jgi:mRNA interferase RelE/StbE
VLRLDISRDSLRDLQTLNPKQYRQVVGTVLRLLQNSEPHDSFPLTGYPYRRVDIGEYRIIYRVDGDILKVFLIGKRNDDEIYRNVRRLRS